VAAGTSSGLYSFHYKICKPGSASICSTATVSVQVYQVVAVADNVATFDGTAGGTAIANVLANDTLNGVTATLSTVDLSLVDSLPTGFSFDITTGAVTVAAGTSSGPYSFQYKICKTGSASICSTATVRVQVAVARIGLAKALIGSPVKISAGVFEITYEFRLRNYGTVALSSVQVIDDLATIFASPTTYTVVQPLISSGFTVNTSFNGASDKNLLSATGNTLGVSNSYKTITMVLQVTPTSVGPFSNTASASALDPSSNIVTDVSQDGSDPDQTSTGLPANNADGDPTNNAGSTAVTFAASLFDPPFGIKTFDDRGLPVLRWTMIWINETNIPALSALVSDPISEGTEFAGDLVCTPASGLTTVATCAFEPASVTYPRGRVLWTGTMGPDLGHLTAETAANELNISFNVRVLSGTSEVNNTASISTDIDGIHGIDQVSGSSLATSQSKWIKTEFKSAKKLPVTGFAPGIVSLPPAMPHAAAYQSYSDLVLEIPELNIRSNIVGVPMTNGNWDTTWLGNNAGYLAGTAFPSWKGNSAITGHVYAYNGKPGLFVNLSQLKWGSQVRIHAYGEIYTYEVRLVKTIWPDEVWVLGHKPEAWLTLLTCKDYDPLSQNYKLRTVVQALLVGVQAEQER
ncbi:MAG: sortase, partial [Chloroflexi bacterium]|nr:sortase [Chloroflexota bacterium]